MAISLGTVAELAKLPPANPTPRTPEQVLRMLISTERPPGEGLSQWSSKSSSEQLRAVTPAARDVELARAEIRGNQILVKPERSDIQDFTLPNNVGATGFSPGNFTHDYLVPVIGPPAIRGREGLAAVGKALAADATPGVDLPATPKVAVNNVGHLVYGDGNTNLVRSYGIPSGDPDRSAAVVNYTIAGKHSMSEGFVIRYAELRPDGRVELVTYGEGNALKQSFLTKGYWKPEVDRVWKQNAIEIFSTASRNRQK